MPAQNLQELLDASGDTVELLRDSQLGAYIYPVVPCEFTNWRREQRAWRETAVLFDQSHHMVNLFLRGPDALQADLRHGDQQRRQLPGEHGQAVRPDRRRRRTSSATASCSISPRRSSSTSAARPVANWLQFHGRDRAATTSRSRNDDRSPSRPYGKPVTREYWRFQIQGPNAWAVIEKLNGGPVEQLKFFRMGGHERSPARRVRTLRHGMAGRAGSGDLGSVRELRRDPRGDPRGRAGSSGWSPCGVARLLVQHARVGLDPLAAARPSTPARSCARTASGCPPTATRRRTRSPAASCPDDIEDYYLNPWELGYGPFVKFDHDFIGRDALEQIDPEAQRKKVTLAWNAEDVAKILAVADRPRRRPATSSSTCRSPTTARRTSTPCSTPTATCVGCRCSPATARTSGGRCRWRPWTRTSRSAPRCRSSGASRTAGRSKTTVEPHEQLAVRAVVSPVPYSDDRPAGVRGGLAQGGKPLMSDRRLL